MGGPQTELTLLGRRVKDALDGHRGAADDIGIARSGFMEALADGTRRHWWTPTRARLIALGAVLALALAYRLLAPRRPVTFEVGLEGEKGELYRAVNAPVSEPLRLPFSDGSSAQLAPGARLRVLQAGVDGAQLLLEAGESTLDVRGTWRLETGPFSIETRDAHFRARWTPGADVLSLEVQEGGVEVTGETLMTARKLVAGEELMLTSRREGDWATELAPQLPPDPLLDLLLVPDPDPAPAM